MQFAQDETEIWDFISDNIRDTLRHTCKQAWLRGSKISSDNPGLPIKIHDMTDHYHQRALHI